MNCETCGWQIVWGHALWCPEVRPEPDGEPEPTEPTELDPWEEACV